MVASVGLLITTIAKFGVATAGTVGITKGIDYFHTFEKRWKTNSKKTSTKEGKHDYEKIKQDLMDSTPSQGSSIPQETL
ncbi:MULTISPECIES: hypothetical protein [Bacillus cereus group]|uniref:Uncharacterized protein n=1 Tax=Bacillus thuringiensis subsp. jegathesan TaxID=56955 RepID=A0A9X6MF63_BACTJ|nr:hypothetical protein [Bacillus thuringiensis]OUB76930.1 hypothetical protein BK750_03400 [Bacillus thuringiensis serovar jegathesan]